MNSIEMKLSRNVYKISTRAGAVFPFAEFDPVLRRDLNAALDAARRELERSGVMRRSANGGSC
jgi:hypothetical protein